MKNNKREIDPELIEAGFVRTMQRALVEENWNFSAACRYAGISQHAARYRLKKTNSGRKLLTEYRQRINDGERVRDGNTQTPRVLWQDEHEYQAQQRHAARLALTKGRAGAWQVWARLALREVRQAESRAIALSYERADGTHEKSNAFLDALFELETRFGCTVDGVSFFAPESPESAGHEGALAYIRSGWREARRKGEPWGGR